MDKEKVIHLLISSVSKELQSLCEIAENARKSATSKELKQEGKYDTRAIEEGYLAGAQAKRVVELQADLTHLNALLDKNSQNTSSTKVISGSIVELKSDKKEMTYFLSPSSGGQKIEIKGKSITTLSLNSIIASELIGLEVGDEFEVETPKGYQNFEVISIY